MLLSGSFNSFHGVSRGLKHTTVSLPKISQSLLRKWSSFRPEETSAAWTITASDSSQPMLLGSPSADTLEKMKKRTVMARRLAKRIFNALSYPASPKSPQTSFFELPPGSESSVGSTSTGEMTSQPSIGVLGGPYLDSLPLSENVGGARQFLVRRGLRGRLWPGFRKRAQRIKRPLNQRQALVVQLVREVEVCHR